MEGHQQTFRRTYRVRIMPSFSQCVYSIAHEEQMSRPRKGGRFRPPCFRSRWGYLRLIFSTFTSSTSCSVMFL